MESQPELFNQLRQLDLWKQVYTLGIEGLENVSKCEWNFSNLDDAFEEGGVLHGNKVYLFSFSEPQLLFFCGQWKVIAIPTVVAIVSPSPPSDKIAVLTTGTNDLEYLDMRQMNMDWVPYTPHEQLGPPFERLETQIFILNGVQRRADLKDHYVGPYIYNPLIEDAKSVPFNIIYPYQPEPVVCWFHLEMFDLEVEEVVDELIATDKLSEYHKDDFKEFAWTKFREQEMAYHEIHVSPLPFPPPPHTSVTLVPWIDWRFAENFSVWKEIQEVKEDLGRGGAHARAITRDLMLENVGNLRQFNQAEFNEAAAQHNDNNPNNNGDQQVQGDLNLVRGRT